MPRLTAAARRALQEERRAQILAAAARVFARKGFERATVGDVAAEAGVAAGSIYRYFRNKADLLVGIPRQVVLPAAQALHAVMAEDAPPEQVLTLAARQILLVVHQNDDLMRVMLSSLPTMQTATRRKYLEGAPLYVFGILESYFRRQIAAGILRPDLDPVLAARMFPGTIFVFALLHTVMRVPETAGAGDEAVVAHAVRLFLDGARARPKGKR